MSGTARLPSYNAVRAASLPGSPPACRRLARLSGISDTLAQGRGLYAN
jgi:hypothetical protein